MINLDRWVGTNKNKETQIRRKKTNKQKWSEPQVGWRGKTIIDCLIWTHSRAQSVTSTSSSALLCSLLGVSGIDHILPPQARLHSRGADETRTRSSRSSSSLQPPYYPSDWPERQTIQRRRRRRRATIHTTMKKRLNTVADKNSVLDRCLKILVHTYIYLSFAFFLIILVVVIWSTRHSSPKSNWTLTFSIYLFRGYVRIPVTRTQNFALFTPTTWNPMIQATSTIRHLLTMLLLLPPLLLRPNTSAMK